jgi:adenosylmethionine-8-amino-7-oxononanoate aminotransferase
MGIHGYTGGATRLIKTVPLPDPTNDPKLDALRLRDFFRQYGHSVAAIYLEYVQGSGGIRVLPKAYAQQLWKLAKNNEILIIGDEIATGLYRSGKFVAAEHYNLWPDILLLGKALTGGYAPLSAVAVTGTIFNKVHSDGQLGRLAGFTTGGHPVSCSVALAVLKLTNRTRFTNHLARAAAHLRKRLTSLPPTLPVKEVRGLGHMYGIVIHEDKLKHMGTPLEFIKRVTLLAVKKRIVLHPLQNGTIPVLPALTASIEQLDVISDRLIAVLRAL